MTTQTNFSLWLRPKLWIGLAVVVLFSVWLGIPTFNKWRADKLVDELCAKDGGIKVYERVKLPAARFSEFGEIYVPPQKSALPIDEYFYTSETQWIIPEGTQVRDIALWRYHDKLFRAEDSKLLAEGVGYARRGGDAAGPWHPSGYSCHGQSDIKYVSQKTFIRDEKDWEIK